MNDLTSFLPPELRRPMEQRIAEAGYRDAQDYLGELVRRDLEEAADTAWVREKVAEGLASGFIDRDAREVLREIVAERHAKRG